MEVIKINNKTFFIPYMERGDLGYNFYYPATNNLQGEKLFVQASNEAEAEELLEFLNQNKHLNVIYSDGVAIRRTCTLVYRPKEKARLFEVRVDFAS